MSTPSLDDREIEIIVLALRFWRAQRSSGETRRTDSLFAPDAVDVLLAKFQGWRLQPMPPEPALLPDPSDVSSR